MSSLSFSNTSPLERLVRVALGVLMLSLGWQESAGWAFALRIFALYPLITGLAGWCPIYALLRWSSKSR